MFDYETVWMISQMISVGTKIVHFSSKAYFTQWMAAYYKTRNIGTQAEHQNNGGTTEYFGIHLKVEREKSRGTT